MKKVNSKKSNDMNHQVENIYLRAQMRDYSKLFIKKEQTEYRMLDYCHKAQYADEIIKKRVRDMK